MSASIYLIALLGCGESDAACREVATLRTRFASEAACMAATPQALERHLDLPYPNVVAQCRREGSPVIALRGSDVARPTGPNPVRTAMARTWRARWFR